MENISIGITGNATPLYREIIRQANLAERQLRKKPITFNEKKITSNFRTMTAEVERFDKSITRMTSVMQTFGQSALILFGVQNAFAGMIKSTIEVEKRITDIAVVLGVGTSALEGFKKEMFDIAKNTAQSFKDVADAATEFSRQGLGLAETLKRTNDAMILSRTTGMAAEAAVSSLTATVNSFRSEMIDTTKVVNTFRNVDTGFAVSANDLAEGIKRAGASASAAKVSFNELNALITSLQENTARGGATIGNSLKSIFTRLQRGSVMDALEGIGVQTKDAAGDIRPAVEVLQDMSKAMQNLSDAERANIKEKVAGAYQINALNALLADLSAGYSTYGASLKVAANTSNEAYLSNEKLNESLHATLTNTANSLLNLGSSLGGSLLSGSVKDVLTSLNDSLNDVNQGIATGEGLGAAILDGVKNTFGGAGLVVLTAAFAKLTVLVAKGASSQFQSWFKVSSESQKIADIQERVRAVLSSQDPIHRSLLNTSRSRAEMEARILSIIEAENAQLRTREALSRSFSTSIVRSGGASRVRNAANGFLPIGKEQKMINLGVGGAPRSAKPVVIDDFNYGNGKVAPIVANSSEVLIRGAGGDTILNKDMLKRMGLSATTPNAAKGSPYQFWKGNPLEDLVRTVSIKNLANEVNKNSFGNSIGNNSASVGGSLSNYLDKKSNFGAVDISNAVYRENAKKQAEAQRAAQKKIDDNKANAKDLLTKKAIREKEARDSELQRQANAKYIRDREDQIAKEKAAAIRAERHAERRRMIQIERDRRAAQLEKAQADIINKANRDRIRSERMAKGMAGLGMASFAVPMLGGAIASRQSNDTDKKFVNDLSSAIGLSLSGAMFGPKGLAVTAVAGAYQVANAFSSRNLSRKIDQDGLDRKLTDSTLRLESNSSSFRQFQELLANRDAMLKDGNLVGADALTRDISENIAKTQSEDLRDAMQSALVSTKDLAETQVELASAMKKYRDGTEREISSQTAQKDLGDLIKNNSGLIRGASVGNDISSLRQISSLVAKSVDVGKLSNRSIDRIGQVASGADAGEGFLQSIGLGDIAGVLDAAGISTDAINNLVAAYLNSSIKSNEYAQSLSNVAIAQSNATKSAEGLIKIQNSIRKSNKLLKDLDTKNLLDVSSAKVDSSNLSDLEKALYSFRRENIDILQDTSNSIEPLLEKFTDSTLQGLAKIAGVDNAYELKNAIDELNKKGDLSFFLDKISSSGFLNGSEETFKIVEELKKLKDIQSKAFEKASALYEIQKNSIKKEEYSMRTAAMADPSYSKSLQSATRATFTSSKERRRLDFNLINSHNSENIRNANSNINNNRVAESRARLALFETLQRGGLDRISTASVEERDEVRKKLTNEYKGDVENIILDDMKKLLVGQLGQAKGINGMREFGGLQMDNLISRIQSSTNPEEISKIIKDFPSVMEKVANMNDRNGLIGRNEIEDIRSGGKNVYESIVGVSTQLENMGGVVAAKLEKVFGSTVVNEELDVLNKIHQSLESNLRSLSSTSLKNQEYLNFLESKGVAESLSIKKGNAFKSSLDEANIIRGKISDLSNGDVLAAIETNKRVNARIRSIPREIISTNKNGIPETKVVDNFGGIPYSEMLGNKTIEDLEKQYGRDSLKKIPSGIMSELKQKQSIPNRFLDPSSSTGFINPYNETKKLEESLFKILPRFNSTQLDSLSTNVQRNALSLNKDFSQENLSRIATNLHKYTNFDTFIPSGFAEKVSGYSNSKDPTDVSMKQVSEVFSELEKRIGYFSSVLSQESISRLTEGFTESVRNSQKSISGVKNSENLDTGEITAMFKELSDAIRSEVKKTISEKQKPQASVDPKSTNITIDVSGTLNVSGSSISIPEEDKKQIAQIAFSQISKGLAATPNGVVPFNVG